MPDSWGDWLSENRKAIRESLKIIFEWLMPPRRLPESNPQSIPGVLLLGSGGVGKSTFGKILAGDFDFLIDTPVGYDESIFDERFSDVKAGIEIVVPPGQEHRRSSTWPMHMEALSRGEYRGLILMGSYGYHNHELGREVSYKHHRLYSGNKSKFLTEFTNERRQEELKILREISQHMTLPASGKFWILSVITKQDLWCDQQAEVDQFYKSDEYFNLIQDIINKHGSARFRHEITYSSLVISNFMTGKAELLQSNTAGYDHARQAQSLRRLFEVLDSLRRWEQDK